MQVRTAVRPARVALLVLSLLLVLAAVALLAMVATPDIGLAAR